MLVHTLRPGDLVVRDNLGSHKATVLTERLPAVDGACAEALAQSVHSGDVILNILARSRDPAPPPPQLTSPALRLVHEPVAYCYRYDLLRRDE